MNHDKSELENKRQTWTNDVKDFTSQAIFYKNTCREPR
nr:MAG TPA: hypothetical protein [Caudoviricetes sp.]